jgi:hypothetical protein
LASKPKINELIFLGWDELVFSLVDRVEVIVRLVVGFADKLRVFEESIVEIWYELDMT